MKKTIGKIVTFARGVHADSLYRNSLYLIAANMVMAGLGFVFWTINARLYTPAQVGLATTLISLTTLIGSFSMLGFNTAIIRFLPKEEDKNAFINTAYAAVGMAAFILTFVFIAFIDRISPALEFIKYSPVFTLSLAVFMLVSSLNGLNDSIFIALRNARLSLITATVFSISKVIFTVLLAVMGAYGMINAIMVSVNLSFVTGIMILTLLFGIRFWPKIKMSVVRKTYRFSMGNYLAGVISMIPANITPLLITNRLGPEYAAYYYMPNMILQLLLTIPRATTSSLFAEGSQDDSNLKDKTLKAIKSIYSMLIPTTLFIILLARPILSLFGNTYAQEGYLFLTLSLIGILIGSINYIFAPILNIKKNIKLIIMLSVISSIIGISLTLVFLPHGIYGLAISGIIGHCIFLCINIIVLIKSRRKQVLN